MQSAAGRAVSFDDLVGAGEDRWRDQQGQHLCAPEIDASSRSTARQARVTASHLSKRIDKSDAGFGNMPNIAGCESEAVLQRRRHELAVLDRHRWIKRHDQSP